MTFELIPAIDLLEGRGVRLTQGRYDAATVYAEDPGATAAEFVAAGVTRVHVVDLDGAKAGRPVNGAAIEKIVASAAGVPVQLGGGIRTLEAVAEALERGVERVILGTVALRDPGLVKAAAQRFPGRVAVGIDAKDGHVAVEGWLETSEARVIDLAREFEGAGVAALIYTDIARDGMLTGPNFEATAELAEAVSIPVILSGGVSSEDDVVRAAALGTLAGAIVGRAIYTGDVQIARTLEKLRMLLKRIIPCLDVDKGRVVKGVKYVDHVDAGDPVEVAQMYDAQEADEITFLDITASHEGRGILLDVVARTAETVFMPLTVGGGVRSIQDIRDLLNAGADKVSIMTAAVQDPDLVGEAAVKIGSANLVLAIDARARQAEAGQPGSWEVCTHGGRRPTGIDAVEWASRMARAGAGEILLTSMDRDGTKSGYDLELLRAVADEVSIPVIASGGGGSAEDLATALGDGPDGGHCQAALAASIFHFKETTVPEVKQRLAELGIPVRAPSLDAPAALR